MEDYFTIGKIVNTVGVKGELKIFPTTDDPKRFDLLETVCIQLRGDEITKKIQKVRYHRNLVMLTLDGVDSVEAADALRGGIITISRVDALPLDDNEYYLQDLVGMSVLTDCGSVLGTIGDVIFTAANDVYVVRRVNQKDLLIPAIEQCILNVDVAAKQMVVRLLENMEP